MKPASPSVTIALAGQAGMGKAVPVCFPLAGDSLGGSHHSLRGLLRRIDPVRFRPIVVVERRDGRLAEFFREFDPLEDPAAPQQGFDAGRSFGLTSFLKTLPGVCRRARLLGEQGVTIVHTNDGRSHATWSLAAKLAGCRLVWHHRADPEARGLRLLAPWVADRIVAVSRFSLPRSRSTRVAREARVIFSPFDTAIAADRDAMRAKLLAELGLAPDTLICGYFGLIVARKRPLAFADAIAALAALVDRPVVGLIFGDAEHREIEEVLIERIAMPDLAGKIRLMGYRSPGWQWIAGCDVLLVPAVDEPLGRTMVEAMLVGTPVIAADSGGNPEALLEGTGVLVAADQPAAMAHACSRLLADTGTLARMVDKARKSAIERFGEERHAAEIAAIYADLLGGPVVHSGTANAATHSAR